MQIGQCEAEQMECCMMQNCLFFNENEPNLRVLCVSCHIDGCVSKLEQSRVQTTQKAIEN
jgi:hypothetical protein